MQCGYELDNGTTIVSSLVGGIEWHICIPEKSNLWSLPSNQLKKVLAEAKELVPYATEIENIDCYLSPGWEKHFCVKSHTVHMVEGALSTLKNIKNNPLADENIKQSVRNILEQYAQYQTKKALQKSTPSTIRRKVISRVP